MPKQRQTPWETLDQLRSRGSSTTKAARLADLHQTREATLAQFFTPAWVVEQAWRLIAPAFEPGSRYSLLDNSLGSASWFRCADPEHHTLSGFDIDGQLIHDVTRVLDNAGYELDIQSVGMERVRMGRYSAALINPPFSIPLASPFLTSYPGVTHYGRHGPHTSALSQEYALAQALAHADLVVALVPRTTADRLQEFGAEMAGRLRARFALPRTTFKAEQVESVATDLLIFGQDPNHGPALEGRLSPKHTPTPLQGVRCRSIEDLGSQCHPLRVLGAEEGRAVITRPVTGDRRVHLVRAGRWIKPRFFCGATEGRVLNALYRERLFSTREHRYPKGTRYSGQLALSLDVLVLQEDPWQALDELCERIRSAGGEPIVSPGTRRGLVRLIKEHARMSVPYGRTVYRKGAPSFTATARRMALLNRREPGAAVGSGEQITATRTEAGFRVETARGTFSCEHDLFFSVFEAQDSVSDAGYWEEIHPPIRASFPEEIAALEARARGLGLDQWLTWDFQLEDLCELAFRPVGGVAGWQMALGKSRLALALAMLNAGPAALIVVKSRLISEMLREIRALGIDEACYQVIRTPTQARAPRKINLISYERLRSPLNRRCPKHTYGRLMKGRYQTVLADEGGLLANEHTAQVRALWQLKARRRYAFDGTPFPNYAREMLPLAAWAVGQGRSYQPYDLRAGYLEPRLFTSAKFQDTGRAAFQAHYVLMDWATNEFLDSGVGAKREIPKIRPENLVRFRHWLAPIIKRRVQQEPAVARHVRFPVPVLNAPTRVRWKLDHLMLYIQAVEDFADWYRRQVEEDEDDGGRRRYNLTMILARLEACFKAANNPRTVSGFAAPYYDLTSKDEACIERVRELVGAGRRPIVFARNPAVLRRLSGELDGLGITNMVFTGEEVISKRIARLDEGIREGDLQVLLASLGVTQDGLNLPQLNAFLFYNRSWKAREEFQAIYRLIRPQQTSDVFGDFLALEGSIDEYMGQMIDWKAMASEAGLDYGEQPDGDEFVAFDAFIYRFLESLPLLKEQVKHLRSSERHAA